MHETEYAAMKPEKLDLLRKCYEDLQFCAMNEDFLLAPDKLYDIHKKLCEIFISEDPFADKTMLFVNDLMQVSLDLKNDLP